MIISTSSLLSHLQTLVPSRCCAQPPRSFPFLYSSLKPWRASLDNIPLTDISISDLCSFSTNICLTIYKTSVEARLPIFGICSTRAQCRDGGIALLNMTYLPRRKVLEDLDILDLTRYTDRNAPIRSTRRFLNIPDPEDNNWKFLKLFDVTLNSNTRLFGVSVTAFIP